MSGPALRFAGYSVVRELGRGGFGVVYEALDEALGRKVALKVYHGAFALGAVERERFEREAKIAARIDRPGILPVYKIGELEGVPYLAMQHVDGASLEDVLRELRKVPLERIRRSTFLAALQVALGESSLASMPVPRADPDDASHSEAAAQLALQAAEALARAHEQGIVHRDVKPANLILSRDGRLFVSDFGLARDATLATLTRTGEFHGTPHYLSPEQTLADRKAVDARSDVYSLGATLYALLALQPPHAGASSSDVVRAIAFRRPAPLREQNPAVPRDLALVVAKALERDPSDRYPAMGELAADISRFLAHEAVLARPIGRAGRLVRAAARHRGLAAGAAALALALAAAGAWLALELAQQRTLVAAAREREEDRAKQAAGLVGGLLEAGRIAEALARLAALGELTPAHAALAELSQSAERRARARVAELLALAGEPARSPTPLLDAAGEAGALLAAAPGLLQPDEQAAVAALLERAERVRRALDLHPALRGLFSEDLGTLRDALAAAIAFALEADPDEVRLAAERAGEHASYRAGAAADFTVLWPGRASALPVAEVVLVGACGDRDLAGVDVAGRFVLAVGGGAGDGVADSLAAPLVARNAEVAERAGAAALLVVTAPGADDELPASVLRAEEAARLSVPVLLVRREVSDEWLAGSGHSIAALHEALGTDLVPRSFVLPGLRLELERGLAEDSPVRALAPLLPFVWPREPGELEGETRRLVLGLAGLAPGAQSDALLADALERGKVMDRAWVGQMLHARPRPALADALRRALARSVAEEGEQRVSGFEPRHPVLEGLGVYPWESRRHAGAGLKLGRRWFARDGVLSGGTPSWFTDDASVSGFLLAALSKVDRDAALVFARKLLPRGECVALALLRQERPPGLADALVAAIRSVDARAKAVEGRYSEERALALFRAQAGVALAELGDRRAEGVLLAVVRQRAVLDALTALGWWPEGVLLAVVRQREQSRLLEEDLWHVVEAFASLPPPGPAEELLELVAVAPVQGYDPLANARSVARGLLREPERFAAIRGRVLLLCADVHDPRVLPVLELLAFPDSPPQLGGALEGRLEALARHTSEAIQSRALLALAALQPLPGATLRDALAHPLPGVRQEARNLLIGRLARAPGPAEPAALAVLLNELLASPDPDASTRRSEQEGIPARAIGADWRAAARDVLLHERNVAASLAHAPTSLASVRGRALERLLELLTDPRAQASATELADELARFLADPDPEVASRALAARSGLDAAARGAAGTLLATATGGVRERTVAWLAGEPRLRALLLDENADLLELVAPLPRAGRRSARVGAPLAPDFARALFESLSRADLARWSEAERGALLELVQRAPPELGERAARAADLAARSSLVSDPAPPGVEPLALALAELAVRASGEQDAGPLRTLARAWQRLGDTAQAVGLAERALALVPPGDGIACALERDLRRYRAARAPLASAEGR